MEPSGSPHSQKRRVVARGRYRGSPVGLRDALLCRPRLALDPDEGEARLAPTTRPTTLLDQAPGRGYDRGQPLRPCAVSAGSASALDRREGAMQTVESSVTTARHPLDPLTPAEIQAAVSTLRRARGLADSARFVYVNLREPPKEAVLSFQDGDQIDREAFLLIRERKERRTYEAVVSVTAGEVRSWRELAGIQPPIMFEEFLATEEAVKKDPRWQEALRKRGVTDYEHVMIDPWSLGYNGPDDAPERGRFIRPLTWVRRKGDEDNGYAHPIEGLVVRFDRDRVGHVGLQAHRLV